MLNKKKTPRRHIRKLFSSVLDLDPQIVDPEHDREFFHLNTKKTSQLTQIGIF
jgi:hypothetical protein